VAALDSSVANKLVRALLHLHLHESGRPDFLGSPPSTLLEVAEASEQTVSRLSRGLGAIGLLVAISASELEKHPAQVETLKSLGLLCSDLGELASSCAILARSCRTAGATGGNG
jgi:hypothetical protein